MTTIEEAVFYKMVHNEALAGLVGARVYPLYVPQAAALPAVAYQKISSTKFQAQDGNSHLARSRFQFTVEADDYADAKDVATAVKNCWNSFAGFVGTTISGLTIQGTSIENDLDGENVGESTRANTPVVVTPVVRIDVVLWHYE